MALEARHVVVRGLVQGVAFRHHTKVRARGLGLDGWVRNRDDGSVEVWAQGEASALEELVEFLQKGPPSARVEAVDLVAVTPEVREPGFAVVGLPRRGGPALDASG